MLTIEAVARNTPEELRRVLPYLRLPSRAEVSAAVTERLRFAGGDPTRFTTAIVVGCHGTDSLAAIAERAPHISRFLLLEPDMRMFRTLLARIEEGVPAGFPPLDKIFVGDVMMPATGYSTDAYFEIAQFLAANNLRLDETILFVDGTQAGEHHAAVVTAANDLLVGHGARFGRLLEDADNLPADTFIAWADHLAKVGEPYQALRFYHLVANDINRAELAPRVVRCWAQLQCFEPIGEWLPHLVFDGDGAAQVDAEFLTCLGAARERTRLCLDGNLAALKKHHPAVHDRLALHRPTGRTMAAVMAAVPWTIEGTGKPTLASGQYVILFEQDDKGRIHDRTASSDPDKVCQALIPAWKDEHAAALLVGSVKQLDLLLNLLVHAPELPYRSWQQAIYVVERDMEVFFQIVRLLDLATFFAKDNIRWFIGDDAPAQLATYLVMHPAKPMPEINIDADASLVATVDSMRQDVTAPARAVAQGGRR